MTRKESLKLKGELTAIKSVSFSTYQPYLFVLHGENHVSVFDLTTRERAFDIEVDEGEFTSLYYVDLGRRKP